MQGQTPGINSIWHQQHDADNHSYLNQY